MPGIKFGEENDEAITWYEIKNCAHDRENISLSLLTTQFEI